MNSVTTQVFEKTPDFPSKKTQKYPDYVNANIMLNYTLDGIFLQI